MHTTTYSLTEADESGTGSYSTGIGLDRDGVTITQASTRTSGSSVSRSIVATSLSNLKKKCLQLKPYSSYRKVDLPEKIFDIFVEVSELATQVANSQYSEYLKITRSVFEGQSLGDGSTVADFFLGCHSSKPQPGSRYGCEKHCAGNLPVEDFTMEHLCGAHVGVYGDDRLIMNYSPIDRSDTIIVYHSERDIKLTSQEISSLRKKGISNVDLVYTGGSVPIKKRVALGSLGKHKLVGKKNYPSRPDARVASRKERQGDGGMCSGGWMIAAIIFFIFLIIIICLVVYCLKGETAANPNLCRNETALLRHPGYNQYGDTEYVNGVGMPPNNYGAESGIVGMKVVPAY
ncbi:Hypothetical protein POVR2_LOCUS355 [uncultured virus]|nr:Hypothetical protein POVR2_LOCUS355 [uncultured virus]